MPNADLERESGLSRADKLSWCVRVLGERITTLALSPETLSAATIREWQTSNGETIPQVSGSRLDLLHLAGSEVAEVYDDETARSFLMGANPIASDKSLALVIGKAQQEDIEETREQVDLALAHFLYS
ncbi:MAG: hypothetical protein ACXWLH_00235 [Candidatus Saccharimonadales bacterium]